MNVLRMKDFLVKRQLVETPTRTLRDRVADRLTTVLFSGIITFVLTVPSGFVALEWGFLWAIICWFTVVVTVGVFVFEIARLYSVLCFLDRNGIRRNSELATVVESNERHDFS